MEKAKYQKPGIPASPYKPLKQEEVRKIADEAMRILEESGMAVYTDEGFEALEAAGAKVDQQTRIVKMPRSMVEDAIASNPSSITLFSRDGEYNAVLEKNRVHYGTGGTAIYVLDPDTGKRRESTVEDVVLNAKMVQILENIHLFTINVFPNDIKSKEEIDVNRFFHALSNTTKHVMGGVYSLGGSKKVVEMAEMIAGNKEKLRKEPFVSFITLIISPFKIDKDYGEMTCYFAREGLPVVVPTEPICGTTSPITLAGNVLTHITETLGGIVLVQSVKKGAPGICGSVGSITNLENMDHLSGAIERAMINAAVSQMAQHFEIPLYSTAGMSDAKELNIQAAYESAMSNLLVALSGPNYIHDSAGLMEFDLTVSYEKLAVDNEILGMCQRALRGIEVNDGTLGTDLIIEKGPGKDFLAEEHTIKYMREEFFHPKLANRQKRDEYTPGEDALSRAKRLVAETRKSGTGVCLDKGLQDSIRKRFPEIVG
jgi:trimethylamine---corrinoid protein Co-methyltransferase